jgi:hypothetical protein
VESADTDQPRVEVTWQLEHCGPQTLTVTGRRGSVEISFFVADAPWCVS